MKQYGKSALVISEEERRETRRYEHEIDMRDRDIEVARQANRSKELDIELRKLEIGIRPEAQNTV